MQRQHLLDRRHEAEVGELLRHDERLRGIDVEVRYDGGVAHLRGAVPTKGHRALLREQISRLAGVYAVWDIVSLQDQGPLLVVDIGAGGRSQVEEAVGIDVVALPGVDVVADLATGIPLADQSVDGVFAVHVLEHVPDMVQVLNEVHRVLQPDGVVHVVSPDWRTANAYADPTHVRYLDVQVFKWFCAPRPGARSWYPLHASTDGASVFADLAPVHAPADSATDEQLARWFD